MPMGKTPLIWPRYGVSVWLVRTAIFQLLEQRIN